MWVTLFSSLFVFVSRMSFVYLIIYCCIDNWLSFLSSTLRFMFQYDSGINAISSSKHRKRQWSSFATIEASVMDYIWLPWNGLKAGKRWMACMVCGPHSLIKNFESLQQKWNYLNFTGHLNVSIASNLL